MEWLNEPITIPTKQISDWLDKPIITFPTKETKESTPKITLEPVGLNDNAKQLGPLVINKPKYSYLKLTPMTSIRNYDSDKIIQLIASLYKNVLGRIHIENKKIFVELASKVGYYIYIEKKKVEFYFIVPDMYKMAIKERIADTWKGITISEVEEMPGFSSQAVCQKIDYKQEDALSIAVDKRTNTLLSSMLNVINILEPEDHIGVLYNFMPSNQYTWKALYEKTLDKYKSNVPIEKEKFSMAYVLKMFAFLTIEVLDIALDSVTSILGDNKNKSKSKKKEDDTITSVLKLQRANELTTATKKKRDSIVIRTQIAVMAESESRNRATSNCRSLCQAYKTISADNELIYRPSTIPKSMDDYSITGITGMYMTPKECQNLLALPGHDLLSSYKCIEKIDTAESEIPQELRTGVMCLGNNTYKGSSQKAYISTDKHLRNLSLVLIGPTRAGKSTLISNLARDAIQANECTIIFDFCGNCQLSDEVTSVVDKVLTIDCNDFKNLQGLGYNEISTFQTDDVFMQYRNAKVQTTQLLTLVNSVNTTDKELSAKMDRYLESAALCVFMCNGNTNEVFRVLQDHTLRTKYINMIPETQKENMLEYISSLQSLDDTDKNGDASGTKYHLIAGIIDRINKLKQNTYMELMFKMNCENNVNLCEEIQKSQLICLKMPEIMFTTEGEKDSYCTYWMTKIWLALQIRNWYIPNERHIKLNIIVDELYQVPNTQEFLRSKLSQMAKFTSKVMISCHYLGQIGIIRNELKAANSSYILIAGCDKDNFRELADELKPYELEDLLNLKRFHALNLIKYENGYASFITSLPPQIKINKKVE